MACVFAARADGQALELNRCVNMGNALEAPNEGEWGYVIEAEHFGAIREAGFDTVRVPVQWTAHLLGEAEQIDPVFLARVDRVIAQALGADLNILLDVHHFEALMARPARHMETFHKVWRQLAEHYKDLPDRVAFEVLNEPNGALNGVAMRKAQAAAIEIIRVHNPTRTIVLGGEQWSNVETIGTNLASGDPNIVYTFHYYEPFDFTHQNAEWTGPDGPKRRRGWGDQADRAELAGYMELARSFVDRTGKRVFLGEFGAYEKAPARDRLRYTRAVREAAEAAGFGWCVWSFSVPFPIYDPLEGAWLPGYLAALGLDEQ